jgi:hypothetical protein
VAFSPRENYTDWATATCRQNLVPTFLDRMVSRGQRGGSPTVVNPSFLDRTTMTLQQGQAETCAVWTSVASFMYPVRLWNLSPVTDCCCHSHWTQPRGTSIHFPSSDLISVVSHLLFGLHSESFAGAGVSPPELCTYSSFRLSNAHVHDNATSFYVLILTMLGDKTTEKNFLFVQ